MKDHEGTVLYSFPKNAFEEVRAIIQTYRGHEVAHIRVYQTDENDVDHPTKKGIAVKIDDLAKLRKAVDALCAAVAKEQACA